MKPQSSRFIRLFAGLPVLIVLILCTLPVASCGNTKTPSAKPESGPREETQSGPLYNKNQFRHDSPLNDHLWQLVLSAVDNGFSPAAVYEDPDSVFGPLFDSLSPADPLLIEGSWATWQEVFVPGSGPKENDPRISWIDVQSGGRQPYVGSRAMSSIIQDRLEPARAHLKGDLLRLQYEEETRWLVRLGDGEDSYYLRNSPLNRAIISNPAKNGIPEAVLEALGNGDSVSTRNTLGFSPLLSAIQTGNPDLVHFLIQLGANPWISDLFGNSILEFADLYAGNAREEIQAILLEALAFQSAPPPENYVPGGKADFRVGQWDLPVAISSLSGLEKTKTPFLPPRTGPAPKTIPAGYSSTYENHYSAATGFFSATTALGTYGLVRFDPQTRPVVLPLPLDAFSSKIFNSAPAVSDTLVWILSGTYLGTDHSDFGERSTFLYLAHAVDKTWRLLHSHNDPFRISAVSPDKSRLIITYNESSLAAVDMAGITHVIPHRINNDNYEITAKPRWLNNDEILFITDQEELIRYDVTRGNSIPIAKDVTGFAVQPWSPNHDLIYITRDGLLAWATLATKASQTWKLQAGSLLDDFLFSSQPFSPVYLVLKKPGEEKKTLVKLEWNNKDLSVIDVGSARYISLIAFNQNRQEIITAVIPDQAENHEQTLIKAVSHRGATVQTIAAVPGYLEYWVNPSAITLHSKLLLAMFEYDDVWTDTFVSVDLDSGTVSNYSTQWRLYPAPPRACPHLHIHDGSDWQLIREITGRNTSSNRQGSDTLAVPPHLIRNGQLRIKITEDLLERTFLDSVRLTAGGRRIYARNHPAPLRENDEDYLILEKGDQVELVFDVPAGSEKNAVLEFNGYYESPR